MVKVAESKMSRDQAYEARGIIARYQRIGHYAVGPFMTVPVYKFLTVDRGGKNRPIAVEFVKPAPMIEDKGEFILNIEALKEGDIVVSPGLIYRKCIMFPKLTAVHMIAMKTYKPKEIIQAEKADAEHIDLGYQNLSSEKITQKDHDKRKTIIQ